MKNILILFLSFVLIENIKAAEAVEPSSELPLNIAWHLNPNIKTSVNLAPALKITKGGSSSIVVGVVDTGIDKNLSDLENNFLLDGKNEILAADFSPKIIKKEDGRVYAAIVKKMSKNYVIEKRKSFPHDNHGHGTHISSLIAANFNKETGTGGIAPLTKIIPMKYYNPYASGTANLEATEAGMKWLSEQNIDILNYSGGGPESSMSELMLLKRLERQGVVVVVAAGNEKSNIDSKIADKAQDSYYPCSYNLSNIICVGAVDQEGNKVASSNWGNRSVHLSAPGEHIKGKLPRNRTGYMTGTSQATALVSGAVALMKSANPDLTPSLIKEILMKTSKKFPGLKGKSVSGGTLDIGAAVEYSKKISVRK